MYLGLIILVAIVAVLLILVVLVQNSKGGGLSSEFSGAGTAQMFGVKKTTDLLEQITWGLAAGIIVISLVSYIVASGGASDAGGINSVNIEKAQNTVVPGAKLPAAPASSRAPAATTPAAPADTTK